MTAINEVRCDHVGCKASTVGPAHGWMALNIVEYRRRGDNVIEPQSRRADVCAVHAQDFLERMGPLPLRT